ncbi:MAG: large conductance mechanosensitive channel protein MscL [Thermoplasmatota archaeon]|nr:large conductance mechanosensitive channel protein MscL [Halobacteriales archaeon]
MVKVLQEFREFAVKGSVVDLAVGVIIGAAFGAIVKSLVDDIIMPLVGLATGGIDFKDRFWLLKAPTKTTPECAAPATGPAMRDCGATVVTYGQFLNTILTFLIVAWVIFLMVKGINRLRRRHQKPADPTERNCPECLTAIPRAAMRCRACGVAVHPISGPPVPA